MGMSRPILAEYDLSGFDAKAPPPKTAAFWDIVRCRQRAGRRRTGRRDRGLGNPDALTLGQLIDCALETA